MKAPGRAVTPRALNGAAIRRHQPELTLQGGADALRPQPLIQQMTEPRGRVVEAFEDSDVRHLG